jgi:membrane protein implicated in regulation of membrane protease activity
METIFHLYNDHAFWVWLAIGGVLLAIEVATGSGWLLWPAGSAAVVAVLSLLGLSFVWEVLIFSALTIGTTLLGRRYLKRTIPSGPDINDTSSHLLGHHGQAVTAFDRGLGRVLIQGKEWAAENDTADPLQPGARVEVVAVLSGARLKVRAAEGGGAAWRSCFTQASGAAPSSPTGCSRNSAFPTRWMTATSAANSTSAPTIWRTIPWARCRR